MTKFYGKYRAKVVDVNDPEKRGRIRVQCPYVLGESKSPWCEPCIPVAYDLGGDFYVPPIGDTVWVEFESGDSSKPIWVGGWWSTEKSPLKDYSKVGKVRVIEFDGCKIEMEKDLITITNGSAVIKMDRDKIYLN